MSRTRPKGRAARLARLLPAGPGTAARAPFVLLVVVLLGGGLITLLLLNSALNEGSFQLSELKKRTTDLTDEEQALQRDVDDYSAPDALERRARELGMVPGGNPAFLEPGRHGQRRPVEPAAAAPARRRRRSPRRPRPSPRSRRATPAGTPAARPARRPPPAGPAVPPAPTAGPPSRPPAPDDPRQVTEVSAREPPRRRVPGPAPARPPAPARRPSGAGAPARPPPRRDAAPRPARHPARQPAAPAAPGQPRPDPGHARLRRTAAPGAGRRRHRVRRQGREEPLRQRTLAAERGEITDRNGVALATSVDAYDITADPTMFTPEEQQVADAPEQAAALLAPDPRPGRDEIARKLKTPNSRYTCSPTARPPRSGTRSRTSSPPSASQGRDRPRRTGQRARGRPPGPAASACIRTATSPPGYWATSTPTARAAAASSRSSTRSCRARTARSATPSPAAGRCPPPAPPRQPAVPGSDVELTIDRDIQWAAQNAITDQVKESKADRGYVIVQDTRTGQVLAMANSPGFDPNDLTRPTPAALGNAALQDAYEPGSTAKVMSMAAVLEENAATPATHVVVPNRLHRGDRLFKDDIDHPTWYLTLNGVLAKSSNIGTILATGQLGKTQAQSNRVLYSYLRKFGIGSPPASTSPARPQGILAPRRTWSTSQQYTIPFGQGLSLNALQAASVYSTIANGGVRVEPTLIRGTNGAGRPLHPRRRSPGRPGWSARRRRRPSPRCWSRSSTTRRAPAPRRASPATASRARPVRPTGWTRPPAATTATPPSFAGFAPADNPRVTVYCAIQNPTKGSYFGGQICGPIYKKVMEFALKTLQVPPTGAPRPRDLRRAPSQP